MNTPHRPILVVIAGPNGSGKTTLTEKLREHVWLQECRYINADDIAKDLGNWNSPDIVLKAAQEAERRREECLSNRQGFAFETVFSTDRNLRLLLRAVKAGFSQGSSSSAPSTRPSTSTAWPLG